MTDQNKTTFKDSRLCLWLFLAIFVICLTPWVPSWLALVLGFVIASLGLVPTTLKLGAITKSMLSYSIVGLGFGITMDKAQEACQQGVVLIIGSIAVTLIVGVILTRLLKIDTKSGYLISSGTAICGGSAIAAVAPAINAKDEQISLALATVFALNAVALVLFPVIGHLLEMSQLQFGLWSAIAIHDTSSVVGAAATYADETGKALEIATTVKLARALFIVPIALISSLFFSGNIRKIRVPLFIVLYIIAVLVCSYVNFDFGFVTSSDIYHFIYECAKRTLVGALFLIGSGITIAKLRKSGPKAMILGIILWIITGTGSLFIILNNY